MLGTLEIVDVSVPAARCPLRYRRPTGAKRKLGQDEERWLHGESKFGAKPKPLAKAPHGTTKPFIPESFAAREAEYNWLVSTQNLELPTIAQELALEGRAAFSLSSSSAESNDDDMEAANIAEHHLGFVPYAMGVDVWVFDVDRVDPDTGDFEPNLERKTLYLDMVEAQARFRQAEWERYFVLSQFGQNRVYLKPGKNSPFAVGWTNRTLERDEVVARHGEALKAIAAGRSMDDIEQARIAAKNARHGLVWSQMTPDQQAAWFNRDPEVVAYLSPVAGVDCIDDWTEAAIRDFDDLAVVLVPDVDDLPKKDEDPTTFVQALVTEAAPRPDPDGGPQELGIYVPTLDATPAYEPSTGEIHFWASDGLSLGEANDLFPSIQAWT